MIDELRGIFVPGDGLRQRLRAICERVGCSANEAIGAVVSVWMFAARTEYAVGEMQLRLDELRDIVKSTLSSQYEPMVMIGAMINANLIEIDGSTIRVNDVSDLVEPLRRLDEFEAKLEKKRYLDMVRKQKRRAELKGDTPQPPPKPEKKEEPKEKPKPKPKPKAKKKAYADYVHMTEAQYNRLIEQFGQEVADEAIAILDNYKGSNGKVYKDDYRAILNWVIDRIKEKKPGLFKPENVAWHNDNPFD